MAFFLFLFGLRLLNASHLALVGCGITRKVPTKVQKIKTKRIQRSMTRQGKAQPGLIGIVDQMIDYATDAQIANQLNQQGLRSPTGHGFSAQRVAFLRRTYSLKPRQQRLREAGMLSSKEVAQRLGISTKTVQIWRDYGMLRAHVYNDRHECLYEPPGPNPPRKLMGLKCPLRVRAAAFKANPHNEVQYEA
jgi:DNA-binding transcriptional regulator YiaG